MTKQELIDKLHNTMAPYDADVVIDDSEFGEHSIDNVSFDGQDIVIK